MQQHSRLYGVHFFDGATSKSGPSMVCFVHFDLQMCFTPQRRALFRHLKVKKWSEPLLFWHSWLGNVLRATAACTFSSLIWPDGSAPAALTRLLFRPSRAPNHWKTTVNRDPASSLFWLSPSLIFSISYLLLPDASHLFFLSFHIVGSLTSKLPSTNFI